MTFTKVILALVWLAAGTLVAQEAKVTPVMSKDLTNFPGKEGLMIMWIIRRAVRTPYIATMHMGLFMSWKARS